MTSTNCIVFSLLIIGCAAQRAMYAGRRPIGYPEIEPSTTTKPAADQLGNRFGEDTPTTTVRLPLEALGDADLVNRLSKLPIDKQPFWLINWQALEANRKNPQTYPQRENPFIDPMPKQRNQMIFR